MGPRAIFEITGIWVLVGTGVADIQMSWVAYFLASIWSAILICRWLYGLIKKRGNE